MKKSKLISSVSTLGVLSTVITTITTSCSCSNDFIVTAKLGDQTLIDSEDVAVGENDVIVFSANNRTITSVSVSPLLDGIATVSSNTVKFNNVDTLPENSGTTTYTFAISDGKEVKTFNLKLHAKPQTSLKVNILGAAEVATYDFEAVYTIVATYRGNPVNIIHVDTEFGTEGIIQATWDSAYPNKLRCLALKEEGSTTITVTVKGDNGMTGTWTSPSPIVVCKDNLPYLVNLSGNLPKTLLLNQLMGPYDLTPSLINSNNSPQIKIVAVSSHIKEIDTSWDEENNKLYLKGITVGNDYTLNVDVICEIKEGGNDPYYGKGKVSLEHVTVLKSGIVTNNQGVIFLDDTKFKLNDLCVNDSNNISIPEYGKSVYTDLDPSTITRISVPEVKSEYTNDDTVINDNFLKGCYNLEDLDVSGISNTLQSITSIGDSFCEGCNKLPSVRENGSPTLDWSKFTSITQIGNHFCDGCQSITNIDLSNTKITDNAVIGDYFAYNCKKLSEVNLGSIRINSFDTTGNSFIYEDVMEAGEDEQLPDWWNKGIVIKMVPTAEEEGKYPELDFVRQFEYMWRKQVETSTTYQYRHLVPQGNSIVLWNNSKDKTYKLSDTDLKLNDLVPEDSGGGLKFKNLIRYDSDGTYSTTLETNKLCALAVKNTVIGTKVTSYTYGVLQLCDSMRALDISGLSQVTKVNNNFLRDCESLHIVDLSPLVNIEEHGFGLNCLRMDKGSTPNEYKLREINIGNLQYSNFTSDDEGNGNFSFVFLIGKGESVSFKTNVIGKNNILSLNGDNNSYKASMVLVLEGGNYYYRHLLWNGNEVSS